MCPLLPPWGDTNTILPTIILNRTKTRKRNHCPHPPKWSKSLSSGVPRVLCRIFSWVCGMKRPGLEAEGVWGGWTTASGRIQACSKPTPVDPIIPFPSCLIPTGIPLPSDVFNLPGCTWAENTLTLQIHHRPQHLCSALSLGSVGLQPETCSGCPVVLGSVILTHPLLADSCFSAGCSATPKSTTRDPAGFRMYLLARPWKNSAPLLGHPCYSRPSRRLWSQGWKSRPSEQAQEALGKHWGTGQSVRKIGRPLELSPSPLEYFLYSVTPTPGVAS